jgi:muramoyltetrapeptide carboxypeptidase LdcA involved in peptidoglycan recycling
MPIVVDVGFGHTEPIVTFRIGVMARLGGTYGTLEILDAAVAESSVELT